MSTVATSASSRTVGDEVVLGQRSSRYTRRLIFNAFMQLLVTVLAALGVGILMIIFLNLVANGFSSLSLDLFTKDALAGGILNAITGTLMLVGAASLISVPIGLLTAIYLSEYGHGRFADMVRFVIDLLAQLPSIVIGLFIWLFVVSYRVLNPTGLTASLALAIVMLPIVARTAEEILRLVPDALREGALALGVPRWRVVLFVVIPTVLPGIITGILMAIARAAGETAPILLVAGNSFVTFDFFNQPIGAIPLQIYLDTNSDNFPRAYAAAIVLVSVLALFSALVRTTTRRVRID